MERVKKGEKYWFIDFSDIWIVDWLSDYGDEGNITHFITKNYFHTEEEACSMLNKLRAVLNGAEVIEMPSEEEIEERRNFWDRTPTNARTGFGDCLQWLKSKIVK